MLGGCIISPVFGLRSESSSGVDIVHVSPDLGDRRDSVRRTETFAIGRRRTHPGTISNLSIPVRKAGPTRDISEDASDLVGRPIVREDPLLPNSVVTSDRFWPRWPSAVRYRVTKPSIKVRIDFADDKSLSLFSHNNFTSKETIIKFHHKRITEITKLKHQYNNKF